MFGNYRSFDGIWSALLTPERIENIITAIGLTLTFKAIKPTWNAAAYVYAAFWVRRHSWEECEPHKGYDFALNQISILSDNNSRLVSARDIKHHACWSVYDIMTVGKYMKMRGWVKIEKIKAEDIGDATCYSLTEKGKTELRRANAGRAASSRT